MKRKSGSPASPPPSSSKPSRRAVVGAAAAGAASAAVLSVMKPMQVFSQPVPRRLDIFTFAKDAKRMATFEGAVREMMDRTKKDRRDPKGWLINANEHRVHCSVPDGAKDQIHKGWWFSVWHRAYLHVTERKIQEISGDKNFRYPYWNWSSDRNIPAAFAVPGSALANAIRYTPPRPINDTEVCYNPNIAAHKKLGVWTLAPTFFYAKQPQDICVSFGGIARPNTFGKDGAGVYEMNAFENAPHGPIHTYTGGFKLADARTDVTNSSDAGSGTAVPSHGSSAFKLCHSGIVCGDMSNFATAARDPIFFAHHGNVDRLWETWRRDPQRKSSEPHSEDFLNHTFHFRWLDGTFIPIQVKDVMNTSNLGYEYEYLGVFRPGEVVASIARNKAKNDLPAIASQQIAVPASIPSTGSGQSLLLRLSDVQSEEMPLSVAVVLKRANAAADDPGMDVGSFAIVPTGAPPNMPGILKNARGWEAKCLVFDVTVAVARHLGQQVKIELIPQRLSGDAGESYPPLKVGGMQFITQRI